MYSQSLNRIRIGQITVRQWYNDILKPHTWQVNFRCSLAYLLSSYWKSKVRYLWAEENIYSQSLNFIRIGQITVRQWSNDILKPQTWQVNFRCSLAYLLSSYWKSKVRYLWTEEHICSQSLNWIRIGQITFRQWYNDILKPQTGQVNFRCSLAYLLSSYLKSKVRYLWTENNIYS